MIMIMIMIIPLYKINFYIYVINNDIFFLLPLPLFKYSNINKISKAQGIYHFTSTSTITNYNF